MTKRDRLLTVAYYSVLLVLQVLAITGRLDEVLPDALALKIGKDSEALLLALGLPAWVQFVRPRLTGRRSEWPVTAVAVALLLALAGWLYVTPPVPGNVETLNEPLFALAALVPYVQLRRPLPRPLVLGLSGGVLLLVLTASGTTLVTNLAEMLAMLVLVPLGLDVVDRAVLDPAAPRMPAAVRWGWYVALLAVPMTISLLLAGEFTGTAGDAVRYAVRVQEAWVGLLLLQLYFAVGHRRLGTPRSSGGARREQTVPAGSRGRLAW